MVPRTTFGQGVGRAVRVQQDRGRTVLLDVRQRGFGDLVVGDRHADESVCVESELDVLGDDLRHEARLSLGPLVLVDVLQFDDVATPGGRPDTGQVDVRELGELALDGLLVLATHVHDRADLTLAVQERRQRRHGVQHAAVLLDDVAAVGGDPVMGDRAENRDLRAQLRQFLPPKVITGSRESETVWWTTLLGPESGGGRLRVFAGPVRGVLDTGRSGCATSRNRDRAPEAAEVRRQLCPGRCRAGSGAVAAGGGKSHYLPIGTTMTPADGGSARQMPDVRYNELPTSSARTPIDDIAQSELAHIRANRTIFGCLPD